MAKKKTVEVELIFDSKGAVTGIKTVDGEILNLSKTAEKTDKRLQKLSDTVKLGLVAAMAGAVAITKKAVSAAGVQQRAEQKLEQALKNTGDASAESAEMLKGLASELQKTSNFGDEMIITAQAMLLSFGEVGGAKGAALLTSRLADVAAGVQKSTGDIVDLNTIAAALGKSLSGGAGSLKEYGISLTKTQEHAFNTTKGLEKVRLLTEILDSNFKGLANATRDPFIQATNAVDDLTQALGSRLRPEIEKTADQFTQFLQDESTIGFVEEISESLLGMGQSVINFFQFKVPIALNNYRLKLAGFAKDVIETHGNIAGAIFNPLKFFKGETIDNPFQKSIDGLDSLRANAHDALVALVLLQKQQEKQRGQSSEGNFNFTGGSATGGGLAPSRPGVQVQQQEDIFVGFDFDDISADVENNAGLVAALVTQYLQLGDALDIVTEKGEKSSKGVDKATLAHERLARQQVNSTDLAIDSGKDLAKAGAETARNVIRQEIAVAVVKSIPKMTFPANLIVGPIAAAATSLLFNKLVPAFADGVTNFGGGMALVGERGPELVNLPHGSNVITNENTEKILAKVSGGSSPQNDFTPALRSLEGAILQSNRDVADQLKNMQIQIDYYGLNDGLERHQKQQASIGGS